MNCVHEITTYMVNRVMIASLFAMAYGNTGTHKHTRLYMQSKRARQANVQTGNEEKLLNPVDIYSLRFVGDVSFFFICFHVHTLVHLVVAVFYLVMFQFVCFIDRFSEVS